VYFSKVITCQFLLICFVVCVRKILDRSDTSLLNSSILYYGPVLSVQNVVILNAVTNNKSVRPKQRSYEKNKPYCRHSRTYSNLKGNKRCLYICFELMHSVDRPGNSRCTKCTTWFCVGCNLQRLRREFHQRSRAIQPQLKCRCCIVRSVYWWGLAGVDDRWLK